LLQLLDLLDDLLPGSLVQLPVLLKGSGISEGPATLTTGQGGQVGRGLLAWGSAVLAHVFQKVFLVLEVDAALNAWEHSWLLILVLIQAGHPIGHLLQQFTQVRPCLDLRQQWLQTLHRSL
jgi:hypothetical protein